MQKRKYLLVIGGPTASGKTALSLRLAQKFQTVILSADSRQFYREMHIGTAKPNAEELAQATHYFIDNQSIEKLYSVGDYEREALELLDNCFQNQDLILLVGGSGLYVQAVCEGLDDFPPIPPEIRNTLNEIHLQNGLLPLQKELSLVDPDYYREVDLQNPQRLIRALEVYRASGKAYSHFRRRDTLSRTFTPIYIYLHWPREQLYERINQRVDLMMEAGLLEEVKKLLPYQSHNALQTVGYQELFAYLQNEYSLEEAVALIKRNSRRFAKRQLTWNRRSGHGKHFSPSEASLLEDYLELVLKTGQQLSLKKEEESHYTLGWFNTESWLGLLSIKKQKKGIALRFSAEATKAIPEDLAFFSLHEVLLRFPDQPISAELPFQWESVLVQLGFASNRGIWRKG